MHTILDTQLKTLTLSDTIRQAIHPLPLLLDAVTKAGLEDEGDPLSSTFEALRVMQTTISQFNPNSGGENSESSSEYTTPAQSQTTSPSHEQSPPPPGYAMQTASATVGSAAKLLAMQTGAGGNGGGGGVRAESPTTSPTHSEKVSSLATHSHHATAGGSGSAGGGSSTPSSSRQRFSQSSSSETCQIQLDVPKTSPRRKSDSEVQRNKVRPASQQLPGTPLEVARRGTHHSHSKSIGQDIK